MEVIFQKQNKIQHLCFYRFNTGHFTNHSAHNSEQVRITRSFYRLWSQVMLFGFPVVFQVQIEYLGKLPPSRGWQAQDRMPRDAEAVPALPTELSCFTRSPQTSPGSLPWKFPCNAPRAGVLQKSVDNGLEVCKSTQQREEITFSRVIQQWLAEYRRWV